ncbi:uncharacterized protein LOC132631206 [Lycium barbarum]|uniref:uncharacterized protein LOC132631206 n=1 Tax=Lycium barbarum TaxID=112863 RepID=UPI00293E2A43|nr:uncharacterized protein LOC132631206 [Lycium barbarum]
MSSTSSSISSPQQVQSRTCKCGLIARYFTATTPENGGRRFYKCRLPASNFCGYWDWIDDKLPPHKVSTLEDKVSMLELKSGLEISNLKKVETLELKVHKLISLLLMSWAVIVGFVIAKIM